MGSLDVNAPIPMEEFGPENPEDGGVDGLVVVLVIVSLILVAALGYKFYTRQNNKAVASLTVN
jgi:hypothetical protein